MKRRTSLIMLQEMFVSAAIAAIIIFFFHKMGRQYSGDISSLLYKSKNYEVYPPKIQDGLSDFRANKDKGFAKVCGCEEAKEQLEDVVLFLKSPEKFKKLGAKMPNGILFTGPPGCGKTLMAKALSEEAQATFFVTNGSSFEDKWVGSGPSNIRKLFKEARERSPSIIFIDEIENISEKRITTENISNGTLNQFLVELDGFTQNDNVIVVGATNLSKNIDPALIRSGRFDRKIEITPPSLITRKELLDMNLKNKKTIPNLNTFKIAKETAGLNGADIVNIVNTAASIAIKNNTMCIDDETLKEACTQVVLGRVNTSLHLSENVRRNTAIHEAGHTLVGLLTKNASKVNQLTIKPRGLSLGSTYFTYREGFTHVQSKDELISSIDVALGGHAAEELLLGRSKATTGASSDFYKATNISMALTGVYGMSKSLGKYSAGNTDMNKWSPFLRKRVIEEARRIVDHSYSRVYSLLEDNRELLEDLAAEVEAKETLSRNDILRIWAQHKK